MNKTRPFHATWLTLLVFLATGSIPAAPIDTQHLQSLGHVDYVEFDSSRLKRSFHVFIDLPTQYAESDATYSVFFLLDGGNSFPLLSAYHHYLTLGNEAPPVIFVGISYGADSFREGNLRQTDFTAPSPVRDFWGGAEVFGRVIEEELIPMIESRYRSDPDRRFLFGHSLGGQFVLHTALRQPQLFRGLVASNPAIRDNLEFFIDPENLAPASAGTTRLFVCMSQWEHAELKSNTLAWWDAWDSFETLPWQLEFRTLPGQTHLSSVAECFRQSLVWLLPETYDGSGDRPGPGQQTPESQ